MSALLQISDPHFGTQRPQVVRALSLLARQVAPQVVLLSGDITQRARRAQFEAARLFVDSLGVPHVVAIPGNHDIPLFNVLARIASPYGGYRRCFGEDLEPRLQTDAFMIACVNTTRASRHTDGEVSPQQVERVAALLRSCPTNLLRVVVTHQPVHVVREQDIDNLLHGRDAAVRSWTDAGMDIVMGGHIHLPYVRSLSEAYANLPRRAWAVQAGTAVSYRVRDGISNSVNVVRYRASEPAARVERWDFDARNQAFEQVNVEELMLDRNAAAQ